MSTCVLNERILRSRRYFRRHGLRGTALKILEVVRDTIHPPNYILYCADLQSLLEVAPELPRPLSVVSLNRREDVSSEALEQNVAHRVAEVDPGKFAMRLSRGACLWMLRQEADVLGFVWTVERTPIQPYFFPLIGGDVHVFDNEVFPEYRGRGFNPLLINTVLVRLRQAGFARAFIETLERNTPEKKSLAKTGFIQIGRARKRTGRRKSVVVWT